VNGHSEAAHPTISAAITCLNEERDLSACLDSLRWCDEIVVVVDTRTTDRSMSIATDAGARVFMRAWEGESHQINFAFDQCSSDWILCLDADEIVTNELRDEMSSVIRLSESADGYYLPRRNIWLGRWIRGGGWYPDYTLRLFRRGQGRSGYVAHKRIEVAGSTAVLRSHLIHGGPRSISEHMAGMAWLTDAEVQEMNANRLKFYWFLPLRPMLAYLRELQSGELTRLRAYLLAKKHFKNRVQIAWAIPFKPLTTFLRMFVIKQGFRDGAHGFWLAVLSAVYVIVKYAKYWAQSHEATQGKPVN
jgi:glycosyltransferase involved in cell wall biosynthesis